MHSVEIVLLMLLSVVASSHLLRLIPISIPLPLVQIALGAFISSFFNYTVELDPSAFFLIFLPPLLFLDGWNIPKGRLLRDRGIILELAFGLVFFTVLGAGYLLHLILPNVPLSVSFALAAIISPTDPVAVSSIAKRVKFPERLMGILEGESLLNDASGLVCFRFAVVAATTGSFVLSKAALTFAWLVIGGFLSGIAVILAISYAVKKLSLLYGDDTGCAILLNLLMPFAAYLVAEALEASGILAAVAAGITMSYVELRGRASPVTRVERSAVWGTIQFSLNGIMFVLLGEQLPSIVMNALNAMHMSLEIAIPLLIGYTLLITLILAVLRYTWVWISFRLHLLRHAKQSNTPFHFNNRLVLVTSLAGVRGAITLAGVLTLPIALSDGTPFPGRDLVIFFAAMVILTSLLLSSFLLPSLLKNMKMPEDSAENQEEKLGRKVAADAAILAIQKTQNDLAAKDNEDLDLYVQAASRLMEHYSVQPNPSENKTTTYDADEIKKAERIETLLHLAAISAQREAIFKLARTYQISDKTSRKLVRKIDMVEELLRQ